MQTIGENTQGGNSPSNKGTDNKPIEAWLCLRFTHLALNSHDLPLKQEPACAITEQQKIWQFNTAAATSSITSNISVNHALMLNPSIHLQERDKQKETQKLTQLSHWAYRFTSHVSAYNSHTLLLEIGKSIKLFNSLEHLLNLINNDLSKFNIETALGLAQTPKAAYVISFAQRDRTNQSSLATPDTLAKVAIEHLDISTNIIKQLHNCGFKYLKCIDNIPNAELGSRFGKEFVYYLKQLRGQLADPQIASIPPETFLESVDFSEPIRNLNWIQQQLDRLLTDLIQFIKLRQLVCRSFTWRFYHENNRLLKTVTIGLSAKQNALAVFQELSELKFAETKLDWEFSSIELSSTQLLPMQLFNDDLFNPQANQQQFNQLMDKLINRLGQSALFRVFAESEHLPELANGRQQAISENVKEKEKPSIYQAALVKDQTTSLKDEPLWLLEHPKRLAQHANQPLFEGPLNIIHGPNRISSHWWAKLQSRDYFIMRQQNGRLLWIFFDRNDHSWHLHGLFS